EYPAVFLFFGLSGRLWVLLSGFIFNMLVIYAIVVGSNEYSSSQHVALACGAILLKLLVAAWAIRTTWVRRLLAPRHVLLLLGVWLLSCIRLLTLFAWLLPDA